LSRLRPSVPLVLFAVFGLLFATAGGISGATRKTTPSTVEITSASRQSIEGTVTSKKAGCVDRRKVFIKHNGTDFGTTRADEEGFWSIAATDTVVQNDVITARIKENNIPGSRRVCLGDKDTFVVPAEVVERELAVSPAGPGKVDSDPAGITNCRDGSGTCEATYDDGTTVTLTATPDAGQTFTGWGGACTGTTTTCTVEMTGNRSVSATFTAASGGGADTCPVPTDVPGPIREVLCLIAETLGG
jgi:uncharacterized repeat protein (TIGR02543 family)